MQRPITLQGCTFDTQDILYITQVRQSGLSAYNFEFKVQLRHDGHHILFMRSGFGMFRRDYLEKTGEEAKSMDKMEELEYTERARRQIDELREFLVSRMHVAPVPELTFD